ncbi:perilipin-1 isoform X1 [Danio rerio]|uniref:Perilipin-1 isoform X1 n=3 Tax=Danio rerio TaxID=7955 RepID=A0AC58HWR8_DANRE|nr:perilipin-1 isoform X1 [Danio rerio]|eukprot:XP_021323484.1 perilipin-1 isoform X1 [Danio rerio]
MASEKKDTGEVLKDQNVFFRILNIRSVNAALESIEKTYTSTKQSHPIISSVCGLYEKGVSRAGNLAVWSMKPALHVLQPQLVAANSMACKGLDRLEEKVPALQSPPAELAANIKGLMSSTLEAAKDGITCPIKHSSNVVLDKVSSRYQQSKNTLSGGIQYILNSKLVFLAEQRASRALSLTENLIDCILPGTSDKTENDRSTEEQQESYVGASDPMPIFSRLGALASTICRRAFEKTFAQLQLSTHQGHTLVKRIPGLNPLVEFTMSTMRTMGGIIKGFPSSMATYLKDGQQHSPLKEMANDEHGQVKSNGLVSGLGQRLLKVYGSVVANIKKTSRTSFNLAKDGVNIVLGSFGTVREKTLHKLSYYGLIPRRLSKTEGGSQPAEKDGAEECLCGFLVLESNVGNIIHSRNDNSEKQPLKVTEPMDISEETRQLKKKLMKQIPMQHRVVLGGSNKKSPTTEPVGRRV